MKAKSLLLTALLSVSVVFISAQGGFQRRSVEERVKATMDKLADFKLDNEKEMQTDSVFTQFYRAQEQKRQESISSGTGDREKMREEMQKLRTDRDEKLKKIFSDEQFNKWKNDIEPSLRPRRPGGGNQ